jgi:hypothetical protein
MSKELNFKPETSYKGYFLVYKEGGKPCCSCGRPLEKLSATRWRCPGGYPEFDIDNGDIMIDKYGTVYLREKEHNNQ